MFKAIKEFLEWKKMSEANRKAAAKQGILFINKLTDIQLLEQVIAEINQNPDLAALFTTSDGCQLSLRVMPHPEPRQLSASTRFNIGEEE